MKSLVKIVGAYARTSRAPVNASCGVCAMALWLNSVSYGNKKLLVSKQITQLELRNMVLCK